MAEFRFGGAGVVCVPEPAYPAGAAAFEHQRSLGIGLLQPAKALAPGVNASAGGLNAAFMPAMTAHRVWPCSQRLGQWLHTRAAPPLTDCSVLELGAGCGLAGLAAWLAGAKAVCVTDLEENLPRLREVVALNHATHAVSVTSLDWTSPTLPPAIAATRWHAVLAADCVFWPALFEPLLATLSALRAADGTGCPRFFFAITDRLGRMQQFEQIAHDAGWTLLPLQMADDVGAASDSERPLPPNSLEAMRRDSCELFELMKMA